MAHKKLRFEDDVKGGLSYMDSPEKIEDRINGSFHLFRDLVIIAAGDESNPEARNTFFEEAGKILGTAREICDLESTEDDFSYVPSYLKVNKEFHDPLFAAVRAYSPGVEDPKLRKIYGQLMDNWMFVTAKYNTYRMDMSTIDTGSSLDIIAEGIDLHKQGRDREFFEKHQALLPPE
ncbi:MAG: hypothetical protein ABH851_09120 [Methanobacteriota archaeon]